jgi:hypothetical protein
MRQARAILPGRSGPEGNRDDPGHLPGYPQTGRLFNPFPRAPIPITTTTNKGEPSTQRGGPLFGHRPGPLFA